MTDAETPPPPPRSESRLRQVVDFSGLLAFGIGFLVMRLRGLDGDEALVNATWFLVAGSAIGVAIGLIVEKRLALLPLLAALAFSDWGWTGLADAMRHPLFSALMLFVVGGLMVSTIPSWSFKNFKVPAQFVLPLLLGTGAFIAFLVTEPWAALTLAVLIYFGMLVFSARSYERLKREAEQAREPAPLA